MSLDSLLDLRISKVVREGLFLFIQYRLRLRLDYNIDSFFDFFGAV